MAQKINKYPCYQEEYEKKIDQPEGNSICCTVIGLNYSLIKTTLSIFFKPTKRRKIRLYETSIGQTIPEDASQTFQTKLESNIKYSSEMFN